MTTHWVPLTVAPEAGLLKAAVMGTVLATVTGIVAVALPPAESRTVSDSVCGALVSLVVSSAYEAVVPLTVCEETTVPSTASWNVFETAVEPLTDIPTVLPSSHITAHAVFLTVVPPVGCVMKTLSVPVVGGGVTVFDTVTLCVAVPVPPAGSVAVAVSVCAPLAIVFVSQEKVGPVPGTAVPSTVSV